MSPVQRSSSQSGSPAAHRHLRPGEVITGTGALNDLIGQGRVPDAHLEGTAVESLPDEGHDLGSTGFDERRLDGGDGNILGSDSRAQDEDCDESLVCHHAPYSIAERVGLRPFVPRRCAESRRLTIIFDPSDRLFHAGSHSQATQWRAGPDPGGPSREISA